MKSISRRPPKVRGGSAVSSDAGPTPQQFAAVAEFARVGIWRWRRGERVIGCSPVLSRMLGMPDGEGAIPARMLLRRLTGEQRARLLDALRRSLPAVTLEIAVADVNRHSRNIIALDLRADGDGFWGVAHDVTALRAVSAALHQSESRWEIALESAGQGVWDSDVLTGQVYHSRTWRSLRGMHPDGDPNDTHEDWLRRVHPDDRERSLALIETQQSGENDRLVFEYRERRPDGRYIWIQSVGQTVAWQDNGRPRRVVGTDTDITERKLAQQAMEGLSRRLELALEVSKLGIFEANLHTREVFWDKRVREIYGLTEDVEIAADLWEAMIHPDDYVTAMKRVWNAIENRGTYHSDFRIVRPNGEVRHIHTEGTWYLGGDGVPKMLGVNWDVTEEVLAKRELERARELAEARNAELEAAKARIEHNALHDALTGLPNRRYLDEHLAGCAEWAAQTGGSVSVVHIDLDLFKQINDTLGHVAGDAMLVHVAGLLRASLDTDDFVARVGGDEFIVVRKTAYGSPALGILAGELITRIRKPVPYEGHFCRFGASIGIASRKGAAVDPMRLLIDADIALYRAKARGKNRFEFFTEQLQAEAVNAKRMADDILRGLEQGEFFPYFQPLFDAADGSIAGIEALARWRHPANGILMPSSFLKVAEDLNVVTAIDRAILEQALKCFDRWRAAGLPVPSVSVNVSFRRLHDQQLIPNLRQLAIAPGTLAFELLESIFLDDLDDIARWNLDQIREMGIDVNIDDFGTGHASIISLLRLRPNRFKLDRQFLENLTVSPAQRRLVRSIIEMGKSLDIQVVGEGVETTEQAAVLAELGCDILQGYAFARPMSAEELEEFLRDKRWRQAS